jgi:DNA-binding NtrC family response regulator
MAGRFHGPGIAERLGLAARTGRHVLLDGESGTGKELAARALHDLMAEDGRAGPLVALNAACYGGEEDAVAGLFGVVEGAFTGVKARSGALASAEGGTFYLDEVHNLPLRVQRSLLRFVEDGLLSPLGATASRKVDVRLVLGTNLGVEDAIDQGQLAADLAARLHRVVVPSLRDRREDVPDILDHVTRRLLPPETAEAVLESLDSSMVARLCQHDFRHGNVRELEDLVALAGSRALSGEPAAEALSAAMEELVPRPSSASARAAPTPRSRYVRHRAEIVAVYHEVDENLTRLEEVLRARGIRCTRRWLAVYLDKWGVRPIQRSQDT